MRARRGFSIPELLVVLILLGLLVRLGFPRYTELRAKAQARAVVGDVLAIRLAAYNYNTEKQAWPAEVGMGTVPPELATVLPIDFSFQRQHWVLDYDVWPGAGNSPGTPVIGVTVDAADPRLVGAIRAAARLGLPYLTSGAQTTFLLAGFGGNY
ncbi:MAG: prepilin-type N-terminal cleavage/methylation domain-containing protein [Gemmatimonadota bacterium]